MSDVTKTETEVDCPGCGLTLIGDTPRMSAEWFCPDCDYPLFWATEPPAPDRSTSRAARRRLPGTDGRSQIGAAACWHCGEMSAAGQVECHRCAATLPKPLAPTVRIVEEIAIPMPIPMHLPVWPYVASAICAGAAIAIPVTIWVTGVGG